MTKTVNTQETQAQETQTNTQNISTAITKAVNDVYSENPFAVVEAKENTAEIRTTTTDNTAKLFNALNGGSEKVADYIGETIEVCDIVVTSANLDKIMGDETSGKECKPCVHFFTTDGKHLSSVSNGICKSTNNLLSIGIIPTADTPLKIKFVEIKTKKGIAHMIELVG